MDKAYWHSKYILHQTGAGPLFIWHTIVPYQKPWKDPKVDSSRLKTLCD